MYQNVPWILLLVVPQTSWVCLDKLLFFFVFKFLFVYLFSCAIHSGYLAAVCELLVAACGI